MFQDKELVDLNQMTSQLGDPIRVGQNNDNVRDTSPAINYAMRVTLDTSSDIEIGKIAAASNITYPGQPKIDKNNKGEYVVAYPGIESVYSTSMLSDPESDGWLDIDNVGDYVDKDKLYKITTTDASFHEVHKDLGYGRKFTADNDFAVRFTFALNSDSRYAGFGITALGYGSAHIGGVVFKLVGDKYVCSVMRGGVVLGTYFELPLNSRYILDMLHSSNTHDTIFKVYGKDGYMGSITEHNFLTPAIESSSVCLFAEAPLATSQSFEVMGVQAWFNTIVVKKSIDNCRTWERIYSNAMPIGNEVSECSVGIDNSGLLYLAWAYYNGSNYYLYYSIYNDGWSIPENVANNTIVQKLNPVLTLSKKKTYVYIAWRELSSSGTDIYLAQKDLIYSDEFEILVV